VLRADVDKPALSPELLALEEKVRAAPFWMVLPFHELARAMPVEDLQADWRELHDDLRRVRLLGLRADVYGRDVNLTVSLLCPDEARAAAVTHALRRFWEKEINPDEDRPRFRVPPPLRELVRILRDQLTFKAEGDLAVMSARVKFEAVAKA